MEEAYYVSFGVGSDECVSYVGDFLFAHDFFSSGFLECGYCWVYFVDLDEVSWAVLSVHLLVHSAADAFSFRACGDQPVVEFGHGCFGELPSEDVFVEFA